MQYTRILALGDSETYGARATHGQTYPFLLEQALNNSYHPTVPAVVLNRGVNGETSWQIIDRAQQYLLNDDWIKICVCMMGTNDSKPSYRTPVDIYLGQWDRLLNLAKCTDTFLFALEPNYIDPVGQPEYDAASVHHLHLLKQHLYSWCDRNGITYIGDIWNTFEARPQLLADGIHPNNDGNSYIASVVAETLGKPIEYRAPQATIQLVTGGPASTTTTSGNGAVTINYSQLKND